MRKHDYYKLPSGKTTFDFHKDVVDGKNYRPSLEAGKVDHKKVAEDMEEDLRNKYQQYDDAFASDSLETLTPLDKTSEQQESLLKLYDYRAPAFVQLRTQLTTNSSGQKETLCPLCLLDHERTLDHCVPKTEFSEFCDHPYNLIPCCNICNSQKSASWRNAGLRTVLNLYLDDIPQSQFLFADVDLVQYQGSKQIVTCQFRIDDPNGDIKDRAMYKKIEYHFTYTSKTGSESILTRYNNEVSNVVSELSAQLTGDIFAMLDNKEVSIQLTHQAQKLQEHYGINYWKAILILAISKRHDIIDFLRQA